jgi:hypothetical protein
VLLAGAAAAALALPAAPVAAADETPHAAPLGGNGATTSLLPPPDDGDPPPYEGTPHVCMPSITWSTSTPVPGAERIEVYVHFDGTGLPQQRSVHKGR